MLLANERLTNRILKVALLSRQQSTFERFLIRSDESTTGADQLHDDQVSCSIPG